MFLTPSAATAVFQQAAQQARRLDAYELISAAAAFASGFALLARTGRRRGRRVDEFLACVAALSIAVLLLHQIVTDGVCHGSCTFSWRPGP